MSDIVDEDWQRKDRDRYFIDITAWGRECLIRTGKIEPETDDERRQAAEGPRIVVELDSFRKSKWEETP